MTTTTEPMTKGLHKTTHGTKMLKADGEAGTATIAFAQLNVVDHDRDVTEPGAFQPGQQVKVCQTGHAHGMRVAGAGTIVGEQEIDGALWAVADLKFFLNTEAGREEYETLKALNDLGHTQEFSYGYDILQASPGEFGGERVQILKSLSVYEISPVLRGAGIGTRQLVVKAQDGTCEACGQSVKAAPPSEPADNPPPVDVVEAKLREAETAFLQWSAMKTRRRFASHTR